MGAIKNNTGGTLILKKLFKIKHKSMYLEDDNSTLQNILIRLMLRSCLSDLKYRITLQLIE